MKLCIGIDPSVAILRSWGLPETAEGAASFAHRLLDLAAETSLAIKPQVAYFEQFGPAGYIALAALIAEARDRGVWVLADAKRTDIGSTSAAYARAWFGLGAPLRADALTATAYMGLGAIMPMIEAAAEDGGQVFVVARSSNPEGNVLQTSGAPAVWEALMAELEGVNRQFSKPVAGAVVGATQVPELQRCHDLAPSVPLLCPGVGAQGADLADLALLPAPLKARMILPISRGIAKAGPEPEALRAALQNYLQQLG